MCWTSVTPTGQKESLHICCPSVSPTSPEKPSQVFHLWCWGMLILKHFFYFYVNNNLCAYCSPQTLSVQLWPYSELIHQMAVTSNLCLYLLAYTNKKTPQWSTDRDLVHLGFSSGEELDIHAEIVLHPAGIYRFSTGGPAGHGRGGCGHSPVGEVLPTQKF